MAWSLTVLPPAMALALLLYGLEALDANGLIFCLSAYCLYFSIGWQSLSKHGWAVHHALNKDMDTAREAVGRIVSRDTQHMDKSAVIKATVESILENGADAIFAPLFWFVIGGPVAVIVYRLANTLDAMWGYRTERYTQFGYFSAKVDDILNYLPARLTALSYALLGNTKNAWRCWQQQASACASPNGGPVMCSGAGSLNVLLGGPTMYHGNWVDKPMMGEGGEVQTGDIAKAIRLVDYSVYLWAAIIVLGATLSFA